MFVANGNVSADGTASAPALADGVLVHPDIRLIHQRILQHSPDYRKYGQAGVSGFADYLFSTPQQPQSARAAFDRLRWGGVCVFVSRDAGQVSAAAKAFGQHGFAIEHGPGFLRRPWLASRKVHYFLARKILLIPPGEDTERFTYHVQLERSSDPAEPWVVLKQVPSAGAVFARLRRRFPDVPADVVESRARKFVDKIFPTFLTREAAILKILQEHLPREYRDRVPRCLGIEKDSRGFVRSLRMNWLRIGGAKLSHLDFARQSADLLRVIHDIAGVIHLDLRLDNFVITENGVGFVDFGSSVRVNENVHENPLLGALFDELMRSSQIQRMLEEMTLSGQVTSHVISRGQQRADRAVDFFYLAVQFNNPHANPDLAGLIEFDSNGEDARHLRQLTEQILRPVNPAQPAYRSAKDILHGIERLHLMPRRSGRAQRQRSDLRQVE